MKILTRYRKKLVIYASAITLGVSGALATSPAAAQDTVT